LDYSDFVASVQGAIAIDNIGNNYLVVEGGALLVSKSLYEEAKISLLITLEE
jgi:hypothetical protein